MRIASYSFGSITIDGQVYKADVIILGDRVVPNWWRKAGHSLCEEDLAEVIEYGPDVLIIGTGASGMMEVPEEVKRFLEDKGIEVISLRTSQAYKVFNEMSESGKRAAGAFHLTC
jgi:hypothetical protein